MMNILRKASSTWRHLFARKVPGSTFSAFPGGDLLRSREQEYMLGELTPQRAVELYRAYRRGDMSEVSLLFSQLEDFDDDVFDGKRARMSALEELQWSVKVDAARADRNLAWRKIAENQAAYLEEVFGAVENFEEAYLSLGMADMRGVAMLETTGRLARRQRWEVTEAWNLARPVPCGPWCYNPEAAPGLAALEELDPRACIIRTAPPIDLPAMFLLVTKYHGLEGWAAYQDTFGVPSIFFELPAGTTQEQQAVYDELASRVIGEGRGTLPAGAKVQTVETGQRDATLFENRARWCKENLTTLYKGGTLTSMAAPDSGTLAGSAHTDSFQRLVAGSARGVARAINQQFVRRVLLDKFPGCPVLARFELEPETVEDKQVVAQTVATLAGAGYRVPVNTVKEMMGFEVTEVRSETGGFDPRMIYATKGAGYVPTLTEMERRTGMDLVPAPTAPGEPLPVLNARAVEAPGGYVLNRTAAEGSGVASRTAAEPDTEQPLTKEELAALSALASQGLNHERINRNAEELAAAMLAAVRPAAKGEENPAAPPRQASPQEPAETRGEG